MDVVGGFGACSFLRLITERTSELKLRSMVGGVRFIVLVSIKIYHSEVLGTIVDT